jgi:mono/diheme cytochrome c family protein
VAGYNARWGKASLVVGNTGEPRRFLRTATLEVALGLAVFFAAAALTQTTASKLVVEEPDARPFEQQAPYEDLVIGLSIDPNRTGLNTYRVSISKDGEPVEAQRVRLTFRYQEDPTIGASSLTLAKSGEDYLGQGPFMTLEGRWRVETEIRRADSPDVVGFFDVRPAGVPVPVETTGTRWANPAPGMSWNEFGGLVLLSAGLGFALARGPLRRTRKEAGWAANGMTMAGFAFGVLLLFGVHGHETPEGLPENPIAPDSNSTTQGRTLFLENCATCHGRSGVPPQGLDLDPYPLDLTVHVPQHPDGQLYNFIANGVPGSAMRAWSEGDGALTEEQIWHIVNFLRTLTPVDR